MPMQSGSGGNGSSFRRDPVSVLFDSAARALLARAYAQPGRWVGTRLANPGARHVTWAASHGINLFRGDPSKKAVGRSVNRWAAAFERALYYNHRWFYTGGSISGGKRMTPATARALRVEHGRELPGGSGLPAGRAVRIMIMTGGRSAERAVHRKSDRNRIYLDNGEPGGKHHDMEDQDW